ncbi:hypothetical protein ABEB36_000565 [Hypothenemus hampei]|uniref:Glucuronosyltransferase n=1 Tax=Hypothenemus hampei TaxID=57062 RepID=A0ABD1FBR9_HYPHA
MSCINFLVLFSALSVTSSLAANILAILPTASFSHQEPFRPLWRELVKRGHNLTLVTTDPMKESLKNFQEIDMSYAYEYLKNYRAVDLAINDSVSNYDKGVAVKRAINDAYIHFFRSPEGQNLIHNKRDNKFDLLMVEANLPAMTVFSWWYQIPFIGLSTLDCSTQFHESVGNYHHPVITPDGNIYIENPDKPNFWERLNSFIYSFFYKLIFLFRVYPFDRAMLQKFFGETVPHVQDIQNNVSMLFIATNPIFHNARPLMPNTITIGNGMQLTEQKPLEKKFLDNAREGAIYFSLGSNLREDHLNASTKSQLIQAFSSLPYNVLWKINDEFKDLPPNIITRKWFNSQLGILKHPNIKLFITQGGLQSMQEAIYADKPMIGIPFFGDQPRNVNRMVQLGYGLKILKQNITKESVQETILKIMMDDRYSIKAKEFGRIFRDVEMNDVIKTVWWTEYVLRHRGAQHFRNPMLDMPFWKIYLLDVIGSIFLGLYVIFKILKFFYTILRSLLVRKNKKIKTQ